MKKPLIIANWKMYLRSPEEIKRFGVGFSRRAKRYTALDIVVAPPGPFLSLTTQALSKTSVRIAAQSVSAYVDDKHTGEVSAVMLKNLGISLVIVGHSERRSAGDTNDIVRSQVGASASSGLFVILCIGEIERDPAGAHFSVIAEQLESALKGATIPATRLVVAYEPVWAIGKSAGEAMQPAELEEMVIFIRKTLADVLGRTAGIKVPILYGGAVEAENSVALFRGSGVSGFLVGHASTQVMPFTELLDALL